MKRKKVDRIIVCGTRTFQDYGLLSKTLDSITVGKKDIEIISGRAKGADTLGERYAKEHAIPLTEFPALWDVYGKSAGPRRNAEMLKYASQENPIIVAFWDGESRGTKNMIDAARKANAEVHVIKCE